METPAEFLCPLTGLLMRDPVLVGGFNYERRSLTKYVARDFTLPDGTPFREHPRFTANRGLREAIERAIAEGRVDGRGRRCDTDDCGPVPFLSGVEIRENLRPPPPAVATDPTLQSDDTGVPTGNFLETKDSLPCCVHSAVVPSADGDIANVVVTITPPSVFRPPVDVICVLDVSGSMDSVAVLPDGVVVGGSSTFSSSSSAVEPPSRRRPIESSTVHSTLSVAAHAVTTLFRSLRANDRFALITFNETAKVLHPWDFVGTSGGAKGCGMPPPHRYPDTLRKLGDGRPLVDQIEASGGTNLWAGLKLAVELMGAGVGRVTTGGFRTRFVEDPSGGRNESLVYGEFDASSKRTRKYDGGRGGLYGEVLLSENAQGRMQHIVVFTDGAPTVRPSGTDAAAASPKAEAVALEALLQDWEGEYAAQSGVVAARKSEVDAAAAASTHVGPIDVGVCEKFTAKGMKGGGDAGACGQVCGGELSEPTAAVFPPAVHMVTFGNEVGSTECARAVAQAGGGIWTHIKEAGEVGVVMSKLTAAVVSTYAPFLDVSYLHPTAPVSVRTASGEALVGLRANPPASASFNSDSQASFEAAGWGVQIPLVTALCGQQRHVVLQLRAEGERGAVLQQGGAFHGWPAGESVGSLRVDWQGPDGLCYRVKHTLSAPVHATASAAAVSAVPHVMVEVVRARLIDALRAAADAGKAGGSSGVEAAADVLRAFADDVSKCVQQLSSVLEAGGVAVGSAVARGVTLAPLPRPGAGGGDAVLTREVGGKVVGAVVGDGTDTPHPVLAQGQTQAHVPQVVSSVGGYGLRGMKLGGGIPAQFGSLPFALPSVGTLAGVLAAQGAGESETAAQLRSRVVAARGQLMAVVEDVHGLLSEGLASASAFTQWGQHALHAAAFVHAREVPVGYRLKSLDVYALRRSGYDMCQGDFNPPAGVDKAVAVPKSTPYQRTLTRFERSSATVGCSGAVTVSYDGRTRTAVRQRSTQERRYT